MEEKENVLYLINYRLLRKMEDKDMVDIDLESVIRFCQKFDKEYLDVLNSNAKK